MCPSPLSNVSEPTIETYLDSGLGHIVISIRSGYLTLALTLTLFNPCLPYPWHAYQYRHFIANKNISVLISIIPWLIVNIRKENLMKPFEQLSPVCDLKYKWSNRRHIYSFRSTGGGETTRPNGGVLKQRLHHSLPPNSIP